MRKPYRPVALVALGFLLMQTMVIPRPALAQQPVPMASHAVPPVTLPVTPMTPQFNDPGPQLTLPSPGNPTQQLSPIEGLAPPPDPLGIK